MGLMAKRLRERIAQEEILVKVGVYDGFSVKLVEQAGFEAAGITGFGVCATLGRPDVGVVTMSEMVERAKYIVDSVNIPVTADGDTGYGNALNVYRTIQEFEAAGVAMIMIEDQVSPKKCGSMKGKEVVSIPEMVGKIKAATDARRDSNLMILARTDAVDVLGREAALERAKKYEEAGADAVIVMSPGTPDDMKRLNKLLKVPSFVAMPESEVWVRNNPLRSPQELQALGFKSVSYPTSILFYTAKCVKDLLGEIKKGGLKEELVSRMMHFKEVTDLLGLPGYYQQQEKYLQD
jgi:2-methylisocitrate lyase-like PEP mutase family enzyme